MQQPTDDLAARLERAGFELDTLIAEVRSGIGSAGRYDALEERADAIARDLRTAFRGAAERPSSLRVTRGRRGGVWA